VRAWSESLRAFPHEIVEARRPVAVETPALLVFGARPARERWRAALVERGLREGTQFAFVA
jgi:hypothetical protein